MQKLPFMEGISDYGASVSQKKSVRCPLYRLISITWNKIVHMWNALNCRAPPCTLIITFAFLKNYVFEGKWHLGVNCENRHDHCHHPLKHGFDYFYGSPFSHVGDCQKTHPPEQDVPTRKKLWSYTTMIALAVLTLFVAKLNHLVPVSWKMIFSLALFGIAFFISWFSSFGFIRYWNCIIMKNYEIIQQPMKVERAAPLMLREAVSFIER